MGQHSITAEALKGELLERFDDLGTLVGKHHISLRWEPTPGIVRVGACLSNYTIEARQRSLETLISFERDHRDQFALEFDIVPLDSVQDENFAQA